MAIERLQKIISRSGITSRRKAEELIRAGRVTVNGEITHELGTKADIETDHVKVDGKLVKPPTQLIYLALNKPKEYVTTLADPEGRPTVMELLRKVKGHVYPIGRLDYHSEGLLLFTNDGDFSNKISSASSGLAKIYLVKVRGTADEKDLERLRQGVVIDGERTRPAQIRFLRNATKVNTDRAPRGFASRKDPIRKSASSENGAPARSGDSEDSANAWYEVSLNQGRQNQIRRMFSLIGHPVQKLKRIQIGPIFLGKLAIGEVRPLTPREIQLVQLGKDAPKVDDRTRDFERARSKAHLEEQLKDSPQDSNEESPEIEPLTATPGEAWSKRSSSTVGAPTYTRPAAASRDTWQQGSRPPRRELGDKAPRRAFTPREYDRTPNREPMDARQDDRRRESSEDSPRRGDRPSPAGGSRYSRPYLGGRGPRRDDERPPRRDQAADAPRREYGAKEYDRPRSREPFEKRPDYRSRESGEESRPSRPPSRPWTSRPPSNSGGSSYSRPYAGARGPRREDDRPPRREQGSDTPRREFGSKDYGRPRSRESFEERPDYRGRGTGEDSRPSRPPSRPWTSRPPSNAGGSTYSRPYSGERGPRRDDSRPPRRDERAESPRRDFGAKEHDRPRNRKPIENQQDNRRRGPVEQSLSGKPRGSGRPPAFGVSDRSRKSPGNRGPRREGGRPPRRDK